MLTQAPRGTKDLFGEEMDRWKKAEAVIEEVTTAFNFHEIRTPMFEHTELFLRGIGDTTDVVQKEMYSFVDKGDRNITMRPELTAGVGRAFVEHNMYADAQPTKLYYVGPCFRYEKPQAGRDRQFTQFGCELYGSAEPSADTEVMALAYGVLTKMGLSGIKAHINSLGCPECRARYNKVLSEYFASRKDELCETCRTRLEKNPLRILDCKDPDCKKVIKNAPTTLDNLCDDCKTHFNTIQDNLKAMGIPFDVDPGIVRGLDYYTRTVFEFVCESIGAQSTVCGGGRYDNLIEELGGPATPAVGFGMGIGRLLMAQEIVCGKQEYAPTIDLYIGSMGPAAQKEAATLAQKLRMKGYSVEYDLLNRSVKAQMKYANKVGAKYTMILGDSEIETGKANLKLMADSRQVEVEWRNISCDLDIDRLFNR